MTSSQGVLFLRNANEEFKWFQDGDEDKDGKYVGEIEYGEPIGQGTYTSPDGEIYVGGWNNFEFHGWGKHTLTNGIKYEGGFKRGDRNGKGTIVLPDG